MGVTLEHVRWCYRLILEREPSPSEVDAHSRAASIHELVGRFLKSLELQSLRHEFAASLVDKWALVDCDEGFRLWVHLRDAAISWSILRGEYERTEIAFVREHVKPGMTALDIGTNIGFYAMLLSSLVGPSGGVVGFEPLPHLYQRAVQSADANGFAWCRIHQAALSSVEGPLRMLTYIDTTNSGGSHLMSADTSVAEGYAAVDVPGRRLSDLAPDRVDFIKIDAEGAEPLALSSYYDQLARHRPVMMAEISPRLIETVAGGTAEDFVKTIESLGYRGYELLSRQPLLAGGIPTPSANNPSPFVTGVFLPACGL